MKEEALAGTGGAPELQVDEPPQEQLRRLWNLSSEAGWTLRIEPDGCTEIEWAGGAVRQITGYTVDEIRRRACGWELVHPADAVAAAEHLRAVLGGHEDEREFRIVAADGEVRWIRHRAAPGRARHGERVLRIYAVARDVTPNRRAQATLLESSQRFRAMVEQSADMMFLIDANAVISYASPSIAQVMGFTPDDAIGRVGFDFIHPDDHSSVAQHLAEVLRSPGVSIRTVFRARHKNGSTRWLDAVATNLLDTPGIEAIFTTQRDITESVETQRRLSFQADALAQINDGVVAIDLEGHIVYWNSAAERMYGYSSTDVRGRFLPEVTRPAVRDPGELAEFWTTLLQTRSARAVVQHHTKDGNEIFVEASASVLTDPDGKQQGVLAVLRDVTAQKRAEEDLREQKERLRLITETIDEVYWMADLEIHKMLYVSPGFERVWGRSRESVYDQPLSFLDTVHPEDRPGLVTGLEAQKRGESFEHEYRIVRPDDSIRWIRNRAYPVRGASGAVTRYVGVAQDVTVRKSLEHQLVQSLKMEAVGRLAGGIAHDFNNQLFVINGYADMLLQHLADDSKLASQAREIRRAGGRAADLTRQLLAYSRKQMLTPVVLDLNAELMSFETMLRRLIGENVVLCLCLEPELGKVKVDPAQIEQVVMNLAVNARDAMPHGGEIVIETANVERHSNSDAPQHGMPSDRCVVLRVSDTGSGMSGETLTHIFEPFFTTKEQGKGTGLGLATVHGIIAQSGGTISVSSQPGEGTTFTVYFPRIDDETIQPASVRPPQRDLCGDEKTVLLVEDEPAVIGLVSTLLASQGFSVTEAVDGVEALASADTLGGKLDLLVTDVVMPRMDGYELARRLAQVFPELKVIFLSGYTELKQREGAFEANGSVFLQKPCPRESLFEAIAQLLGPAVRPARD